MGGRRSTAVEDVVQVLRSEWKRAREHGGGHFGDPGPIGAALDQGTDTWVLGECTQCNQVFALRANSDEAEKLRHWDSMPHKAVKHGHSGLGSRGDNVLDPPRDIVHGSRLVEASDAANTAVLDICNGSY